MRQRRPTMRDVAQEAGVGLKTVSRVVNNDLYGVRPEMAQRVRTAARKLGFRRNDMASNLRAGRAAASIGLVIEDVGNPFYTAIARGVETVTHARGFILMTASSDEDPEQERSLLLELVRRRVDGIIIVPTAADHSFLQNEIDMNLQVVFLDRPATGLTSDTVLLDNRGGARRATDHLLELGHRRIAVLGHEESIWTMQQRVSGYRQALSSAGIAVDEKLVRLGPRTPTEAAEVVGELLDSAEPPTAFFACNNRMTIGVLIELRRRGVDADVAGFDDIETAPLFSQPVALVTYDPYEMGRRAATLLLQRIDGRSTSRRAVIPTALETHGYEV